MVILKEKTSAHFYFIKKEIKNILYRSESHKEWKLHFFLSLENDE